MLGKFSYVPAPVNDPFLDYGTSLAAHAMQVYVFKYEPLLGAEGFTLLPNILCTQVQYKEGQEPPTARFRYVMDTRGPSMGWPNLFEQLWPLNKHETNTRYYVKTDDELVVIVADINGDTGVLFDGFPRLPQANLDSGSEQVEFTAIGVAVRCFDTPIKGRVQRRADLAMDDVQNIQTDLPVIFNPADSQHPTGQPNCTADEADVHEGDDSDSYPVFMDESLDKNPEQRSMWTLSKAVRYILSTTNDEGFVPNPDFSKLTALLDQYEPKQAGGFIDPNDPETYTAHPIILRTIDVTNHSWPDALSRMLNYHNFGMRWIVKSKGFEPDNRLIIYRKDQGSPTLTKQLFHQAYGAPINPAMPNTVGMASAFDYHGVANEFIVETALKRYEISVILVPAFEPKSEDWKNANKKKYLKANLDGAAETTRFAYRRWIANEAGTDPCYDIENRSWNDDGHDLRIDLAEIFPPNEDQTDSYVPRYRPGKHSLLTRNKENNDPFKAQLAFSRDYIPADGNPHIWDGTGEWQPITSDWKLLDDRLGIEFTAEDPDHISIGKYTGANKQESSTALHGIHCLSDPNPAVPGYKKFYLRLTTVIEGDHTLEARAKRRLASPLQNVIQRRIDSKDHFRYDVVDHHSAFWETALTLIPNPRLPPDQQDPTQPHLDLVAPNLSVIIRDDTQYALNYANQLQRAHEFSPMPISYTIPRITFAYQVGDQISGIAGRNASFQSNVGEGQGEAAMYPYVVAVGWSFDGDQQSTNLQLHDRRMEPQPIAGRTHWNASWWKGKGGQ